ncbi:Protein kinase domain-containing protein [Caenorhabditis elegans]|uniref:Protein kinase domain-containing protein n=1 Tax=Caenorhabditis elegans TaxID=6239 RepID=Q9NAC7_CAEEL|nr:Protein kinase domain-containing protein [Caenorhabditis elegans]CAB61068.2 Protein kinase domain-containing protein [Caenorhabditis elegans]|eukprot:NP_497085.2 Uncharacterized protein CELE_Y53F4B.1 [Caenorhabditis elegans]
MLPLSSVELTDIKTDDLDIKWDNVQQFKLGDGSYADVFHVFYKGHDAVLKRSIKEYTDKERENIRREARVVAALNNCENVVRIYGICETLPFRGMIMEYCAGPNLSELVFQLDECKVKFETLRIFKWCHDLTRTLCELNVTYYHGDVKAKNVLVKERPCCCVEGIYENVKIRNTTYSLCTICNGVHLEHLSLKICDFGMSYEHKDKRLYNGGTREFSAPETIRGIYTEKSEVYSFGHLMLVLVIGGPTEDDCAVGQRAFLKMYNNKKYDMSGCKSNSICETIEWCLNNTQESRPTFKQLLSKLNSRHTHYLSLRGTDTRRLEANNEREEFLDHYRIPRKISVHRRTTTTSTCISLSETSGSNQDISVTSAAYLGGPIVNQMFIADTPLASPSASRKFRNDGFEKTNYVENQLYTGDETRKPFLTGGISHPGYSVMRKNSVWKFFVQARNSIRSKITKLVRKRK